MRLLLITHDDLANSTSRSQSRFVNALRARAHVETAMWEAMERPSFEAAVAASRGGGQPYDVCLVFVRFRLLQASGAFDWTGFTGLRAWFDEDAWFNYSPGHRRWNGAFPEVFRRNRFHLLLATGKQTVDLLRRDGVNAAWLPKGYAEDSFFDLKRERDGTCTFGNPWPSRRALLHRLARKGVVVHDVSGPFESLNSRMNEHQIGLVCNMPGRVRFGSLGRPITRLWPEAARSWPAIEPMIKTFETAATGCALVVDHVPDLEDLGFVHGKSCLTYLNFDDVVDLLREPESSELAAIGRAGGDLARSRHRWCDRADQCLEILESHG